MKLFELLFGNLRKFVAAEDVDHAKAIGEDPEASPELHFRPFEVIEIQVEEYDIVVTTAAEQDLQTKGDLVVAHAIRIAAMIGLEGYELAGGLMRVEGQPAEVDPKNETFCVYAMKDEQAVAQFYAKGSIFDNMSIEELGTMAASFLKCKIDSLNLANDPQPPALPVEPTAEPDADRTQEPAGDPVSEPEPPIEPLSTQGEPTIGAAKPIDDMTRDELKAWLDDRNIEYVPQWGDARLRELVLHHLEK